ncbi:MAG: UDP-N-acetylglucosamine 2-epimerase (non-hydrolyzing) [Deltaproteobacteria bacterium]|nr:UDP-N-acetylglucosamine 2-epimerase (non-hydrolyzing) [Deltaproteobacteria bacterium]
MKVMSVVGARPNFMKVAPIINEIRRYNCQRGQSAGAPPHIKHILVHTGQHYDKSLSGLFFSDLKMPAPDVYLGVGSASHAAQTAEVMGSFEPVLMKESPDFLIVAGDVNSTLACALVASKAFYINGERALIAHVESGLRSFDRTMPEEVNRVVTDHISDILFVTEESGVRNLLNEGIPGEKIHFVGNTMIDTLIAFQDKAESSGIIGRLGLTSNSKATAPYGLLTLHRPSNVDNKDAFLNIILALDEFSGQMPVVFPAHPRTMSRIREFGFEGYFHLANNGAEDSLLRSRINLIEPLGYIDFLSLMMNSRIVLTDSGGIQEETTCLGVPCVTLRENTERPVTEKEGTNIVAGVTREGIVSSIKYQLNREFKKKMPKNWNGKASSKIIGVLLKEHGKRNR